MRSSARRTRLVAWLALGCHVLVASGLPLPLVATSAGIRGTAVGRSAKDRSRPFPCMEKPCGCATAEQCFANCCCHTPAERLAWARARRVEAAVLTALERRVAAARPPSSGCCSAGRQQAACGATAAVEPVDPEAPEVCGEYRSLAADPAPEPPADHDTEREAGGVHVVILRDMLACGGVLAGWLACVAALPPPPRVAAPAHDVPTGDVALDDDVAPSAFVDPSTPPPRVG